jgi:hypothetical protein
VSQRGNVLCINGVTSNSAKPGVGRFPVVILDGVVIKERLVFLVKRLGPHKK